MALESRREINDYMKVIIDGCGIIKVQEITKRRFRAFSDGMGTLSCPKKQLKKLPMTLADSVIFLHEKSSWT